MMVFPDPDTCAIIGVDSTPYSVLVPLAKELAQILEGNCSADELQHCKDFLSSAIAEKKGTNEGKPGSKRKNGLVKCGF